MKPVLIVVGGGRSEYRGYILERISRKYALVLLSPQPPTWERPYVIDHLPIGAGEDDEILAAAAEAARRYPVGGVVTYHEACVELVARIGAALDLPQCPPEAAARCRDKHAAREAMRAAGVPVARGVLAASADEAKRAADEIGYPVVVKPRALTAGFGVSLVTGPAELEAAVRTAEANAFPEPWRFRPGILVEEYLDGPEISVDCAVREERPEPVIFARKLLGHAPYFEEIGHITAPAEAVAPDPGRVRDVVVAAHRALGIRSTVTHTEVRLTAAGPKVVEVNGRLGGDVIPLVAQVASGLDLPAASADIAAGAEPDLSAPRDGVAGIRFFYPDSAGRVTGRGMTARPAGLHQVTWLVGAGDELRPEAGRLHFARAGYAIVTADDVDQCAARLEAADRARYLHVEGASE
ncbi:ATP-grasp domain-containing protein [Actinomadura madurae]|uniref:ATP-grasp domain-containing protein n=1 Tax=Actinomadura madurae TaxID=1993 RepID=UPI000D9ABC28|nr:ATP-grasp domain-containing protein [Actinomadura madurae]SPT58089.1 Alanine-anticapsin ligase BacD [Actinomadura madurae]